jgi:anaerobic magnesium-protoporphyrin IX monomethyl ester cyclase
MNVLLIFPPLFNPTQPYLAPFQLRTLLRQLTDWNVDILDWSIESYRQLLSPAFIGRVARHHTTEMPVELMTRLEHANHSLNQPTQAYKQAVTAIDDAFAWYETVFRGTRLFRYCGMESRGWEIGASQDLIDFAKSDSANVFSILYDDLVLPKLSSAEYDAVGITLVCTDQLLATATLAVKLTEQSRRPRLVLGGPLASMLVSRHPESLFLRLFDSVYIGAAKAGAVEAFAPGKCSGSLAAANAHWLVPDWNGTNLESYISPEPVMPIHSTVGCPFSCKYCSSPAVAEMLEGVRFRQRSANDIAEEMCAHLNQGRRYFLLVGEMINWAHASAVARALRTRGVGNRIGWYFWTRVSPTPSQAILDELREQGCRRICFGLETTDENALMLAHKQAYPAEAAETLSRVVRADIQPHLFLMTGLPGQEPVAADEGLVMLLNKLSEDGAYGITATVSAFEPEEWAPWDSALPGLFQLRDRRLDLQIARPATIRAEDHATHLRGILDQCLTDQPFLGSYGNVHQLVFLDGQNAKCRR